MPAANAIRIRAFLRMNASPCVVPGGDRGMLLALRDTGGLFPDGLTALWAGAEATRFLEAHQNDLTPGRCVDVEVYHLRGVRDDLRARIKTCTLAPLPPSWVKHAERAAASTASTATTQEQPQP